MIDKIPVLKKKFSYFYLCLTQDWRHKNLYCNPLMYFHIYLINSDLSQCIKQTKFDNEKHVEILRASRHENVLIRSTAYCNTNDQFQENCVVFSVLQTQTPCIS